MMFGFLARLGAPESAKNPTNWAFRGRTSHLEKSCLSGRGLILRPLYAVPGTAGTEALRTGGAAFLRLQAVKNMLGRLRSVQDLLARPRKK